MPPPYFLELCEITNSKQVNRCVGKIGKLTLNSPRNEDIN